MDVEKSVEEFSALNTSISIEVTKNEERDVEMGFIGEGTANSPKRDFDIQAFFEDSIRSEEGESKMKKLGVTFRNLTVVGKGADASSIQDNLTPLKLLWPPNWYCRTIF